jgi:hypothetical protein
LIVVHNLIWEKGGKPCGIKVEKPTFDGLSQQGYKTAFIPITLLDGDARKNVSEHNGCNCNDNQSISLTICAVLRFEYFFFAFPAENDPYEILKIWVTSLPRKKGFPMDKNSSIFL